MRSNRPADRAVEPNRRYRLHDGSGERLTGAKGDVAYGFVVGSDRQIRLDDVSRLVAAGDLVPLDED